MSLNTIQLILDHGGLLEVIGGLRSKKLEIFLDDLPVSVLKLDSALPKALYEARDVSFSLVREKNGKISAFWNDALIAWLQPEGDLKKGTIQVKEGQFTFLTSATGHQETTVFSAQHNLRLFVFSGGSSLGMRTILTAPTTADPDQWQMILALMLAHLAFIENISHK
ncbi:MAG: hypothetical protein K1Y36_26090 [Blastocatellia bacterium]|nr:hypothetical protein [Blastocatellia bacterium]